MEPVRSIGACAGRPVGGRSVAVGVLTREYRRVSNCAELCSRHISGGVPAASTPADSWRTRLATSETGHVKGLRREPRSP